MSTIKDLVILLHAIEAAKDIEPMGEGEVLNWGYIEDKHQLIQDAVWLADELLVLPSGQQNYNNEIDLRKQGYYVFCLERDGFGWLGGGIHTMKGVIAYG